MANVLIAGGTGMIGSSLCMMLLERNDHVVVLTTQKEPRHQIAGVNYVYWNPRKKMIDPAFNIGECHIINLAGASVAEKRWTEDRKKEIVESRTLSLQTLFQAVASKQIIGKHLLSASAIGYYADSDKIITEEDGPDDSFLSETCVRWEAEALKFKELQIPVAIARLGIVLSHEGGALKEFLNPLRFGIAAIPGSGTQIMSWLHYKDACRLFLFLMDQKAEHIYNAVANEPISANALFDTILKYKKGIKMHVPKFILSLVAGEMYIEIIKNARISNQKICNEGFDFQFKTINQAIADLLKKS